MRQKTATFVDSSDLFGGYDEYLEEFDSVISVSFGDASYTLANHAQIEDALNQLEDEEVASTILERLKTLPEDCLINLEA